MGLSFWVHTNLAFPLLGAVTMHLVHVSDVTDDRLMVEGKTIKLPSVPAAIANGSAKTAWQQTLVTTAGPSSWSGGETAQTVG
jgi:hypothetical protein